MTASSGLDDSPYHTGASTQRPPALPLNCIPFGMIANFSQSGPEKLQIGAMPPKSA
jgi:hypothetical protein